MPISNIPQIGNALFAIRKKIGLTQAELAEKAGLSDRTYADIERGASNMRIETLLNICAALKITPNDILIKDENPLILHGDEIFQRLQSCTPQEQNTALQLLDIYLTSIQK